MVGMPRRLRRMWRFAKRENLHRLLALIGVVVLISALGVLMLEPEMSPINALWWTIVTLTTVGYGDISPVTLGGRIIAVMIMFFGIGLLGMLSATLASVLVEKKFKEDRGMSSYTFEDHVIICGWNHRSRVIISELRADLKTAEAPIVLIASRQHPPLDDADLFFIQGEPDTDTLERANLAQADTVIILGDDTLDTSARDAKVILTTLNVESLNPEVYTIVELSDAGNVQHCKRAKADEIIVGGELSSALISRAALNHGVTRVVSELLSAQFGQELYRVSPPETLVGKNFLELLIKMKEQYQCLVVAIEKGENGELLSNPPLDYQLEERDLLIVIAGKRPRF
ncbi:cag pathogenicity island protein Cag26 [candidate division KSB3 bacterium]|uniref:Cag pathogenicity island protein Cag26 n=1 Tax=candidate division KSB3 bacterium TaxID=2044937 RepID=A0A2G6KB18_9BACT|nr:MAG: cag pathogenicity island protein Cag26 [candidate division KSB3 bacterium]